MFIYTTLSKKRFNKNFTENLIKWYGIWIFTFFAFQTSNRLCRKFNRPIEALLHVLGSWALGDKARFWREGGLGPGKVKRSLCTRSFWKMGELWSIEWHPPKMESWPLKPITEGQAAYYHLMLIMSSQLLWTGGLVEHRPFQDSLYMCPLSLYFCLALDPPFIACPVIVELGPVSISA